MATSAACKPEELRGHTEVGPSLLMLLILDLLKLLGGLQGQLNIECIAVVKLYSTYNIFVKYLHCCCGGSQLLEESDKDTS